MEANYEKTKERMSKDEEYGNCCFCGVSLFDPNGIWHFGHNPAPYGDDDDRCCNECNEVIVVPTRFQQMRDLINAANDNGEEE